MRLARPSRGFCTCLSGLNEAAWSGCASAGRRSPQQPKRGIQALARRPGVHHAGSPGDARPGQRPEQHEAGNPGQQDQGPRIAQPGSSRRRPRCLDNWRRHWRGNRHGRHRRGHHRRGRHKQGRHGHGRHRHGRRSLARRRGPCQDRVRRRCRVRRWSLVRQRHPVRPASRAPDGAAPRHARVRHVVGRGAGRTGDPHASLIPCPARLQQPGARPWEQPRNSRGPQPLPSPKPRRRGRRDAGGSAWCAWKASGWSMAPPPSCTA